MHTCRNRVYESVFVGTNLRMAMRLIHTHAVRDDGSVISESSQYKQLSA